MRAGHAGKHLQTPPDKPRPLCCVRGPLLHSGARRCSRHTRTPDWQDLAAGRSPLAAAGRWLLAVVHRGAIGGPSGPSAPLWCQSTAAATKLSLFPASAHPFADSPSYTVISVPLPVLLHLASPASSVVSCRVVSTLAGLFVDDSRRLAVLQLFAPILARLPTTHTQTHTHTRPPLKGLFLTPSRRSDLICQ